MDKSPSFWWGDLMHRVIRIIVGAEDEIEARETAESLLNETIENGSTGMDYGTFFDEASEVSGESRWGARPVASRISSKEGKQLLLEGLNFDFEEFKRSVSEVKKIINRDLTELYKDFIGLYHFRKCDDPQFVLSEMGFIKVEDVNALLNKKDNNLWIVPCDVHY